ncbi:FAD-dependent oxidoreductase [bacterium]|nr:MAG: FAD-dependent oxidoreductase [bacterium]
MDDVLIVGAGPTGLMLAVWLAANGVKARIVDPKPGPTSETRAVTVQARTLEFFAMLGIAERAAERGRIARASNLWAGGKVVARIPLGEIGKGRSPYPFVLLLSQSETEALLYERLRELGGEVEWGLGVETVERSEVTFNFTPEREKAMFRFIIGCDGASSVVRKAAGFGFPGGTYSGRFYVADVDAKGGLVPGEVNISFDRDRFFAFFPLKAENRYRMVGILNPDLLDEGVTLDDVRPEIEEGMRTTVENANWFSLYRVHHRVVDRFRKGPIFLAGDAAHVHSPFGGQGMNTGLGDAVNLGWKLVEVLKYGASERLLDTYEVERLPFAKALVATTDRAFEMVVRQTPFARFVRTRLIPLVLPFVFRLGFAQRRAFGTVSQTGIDYRKSPLSVGKSGRFVAGDRLPSSDGIQPAAGQWSLVMLENSAKALAWCDRHSILPTVGSGNEILLVRPDGHLGLVREEFDADELDRYMREVVGRPK